MSKVIKPKTNDRKIFVQIKNEIKVFPLPATNEILKLKSVQYFLNQGILEIVDDEKSKSEIRKSNHKKFKSKKERTEKKKENKPKA